jgi:hypothetical protein
VSGNAAFVVFYVVAAVFVASSLFGRRLAAGQVAKMALAWVAIFVVAIAMAVTLEAFGLF